MKRRITVGNIIMAGIVFIAACAIFLSFMLQKRPTEKTIQELDVISENKTDDIKIPVYGDIYMAPDDGFVFENQRDNTVEMSYRVLLNDILLFETDYLRPGQSVLWETDTLEEGLYDCYVEIKTRNSVKETEEAGNTILLRHNLYIDKNLEYEAVKLFEIEIPKIVNFSVLDEKIEMKNNTIVIKRMTDDSGFALPRTENLYVQANPIIMNDIFLNASIKEVTASEDGIITKCNFQYDFESQSLANGNYVTVATFQIDPFNNNISW